MLPALSLVFFLMLGLASLIISVGFALGVHRDASERVYREQPLVYVGPFLWSLATLVTGGLIGGTVYWLLHHSTLSKPATPSA